MEKLTLEQKIEAFLTIGSGYGRGYGRGDGSGDGSGDIKEFGGHKVYIIDSVPTCIEQVHGNYAVGFTFQYFVKTKCFIAREDYYFAHGETLHKAVNSAHDKAMENKPLEERIADTVAKYPDPTSDIPNSELFSLHHILTGSCEFGRRQFCERHSINLNGAMTMCHFIDITCNDYGKDAILQLADKYGYKPKKQ